jgi:hypothetical protein
LRSVPLGSRVIVVERLTNFVSYLIERVADFGLGLINGPPEIVPHFGCNSTADFVDMAMANVGPMRRRRHRLSGRPPMRRHNHGHQDQQENHEEETFHLRSPIPFVVGRSLGGLDMAQPESAGTAGSPSRATL